MAEWLGQEPEHGAAMVPDIARAALTGLRPKPRTRRGHESLDTAATAAASWTARAAAMRARTDATLLPVP